MRTMSAILVGLAAAAMTPWFAATSDPPTLVWTMIDLGTTVQQADSHLLAFPEGRRMLIDAGNTSAPVLHYLRSRHVAALDAVVVSHAHKDHYGGLLGLVEAGIVVHRVYFNLPDRSACDHERPWGCDYEHVLATMAALRRRQIPVLPLAAGDVLYRRGETRLEVLFAYDGLHTPVGRTDINDTSAVLLLTHGHVRALFTGDLNSTMGEYASHDPRLRADLLKVPHHGTEGVVPNEFFDRVCPMVALVPSPTELWLSDRSRRIREYFERRAIPTFVNGIEGDVEVRIGVREFSVETRKRTGVWRVP